MGQLLLAIGVALVFVITAATVWVPHSAARIQNQLHDQARTLLFDAGLGFAAVSIDGRSVVLSGLAPDGGARQRAIDLVWGVEGLYSVEDQIELGERFLLVASLRDGELCLRGVVPSEALKRELLGLSPMPCKHDPDAALGVDATESGWIWPSAVLAEVTKLDRADVEVTEALVRVHGSSANARQGRLIDSALRGVIPAGITVDIEVTSASPASSGQGNER